MTDPQTAADAAERVQRWLDGYDRSDRSDNGPRNGIAASRWTDDTPDLTADALRALLEDRTRMATELEQVRGDWLTQAAQLNRIAGMVGHALILRACDDATPEEVRLALARACEDVHGVIGESEATRAQRTERYLVMCANLLNDHVLRERDGLAERNEEMRDALTVAAELLARLAGPGPCVLDGDGACYGHDGFANGYLSPCPHPRAREFAETWGPAQAQPSAAAAAEPKLGTRTPEQWCAEYGIDIADPDGWRGKGDPAWDEPITLPDFLRRAAVSTTRGLTPDVWNRLNREAHEAADAERSDAEGAGKGPESHGDATDGAPR